YLLILHQVYTPQPSFTLFPYTTLFRSARECDHPAARDRRTRALHPAVSARSARRARSDRPPDAHAADARFPAGGDRLPLEHRCRSEEHTSELQSLAYLVCRLLLEKKKV